MKFLTGILLSTLCLASSAIASAQDKLIVSQCAEHRGFVPITKNTDKATIEGASVKSYNSTNSHSSILDLLLCVNQSVLDSYITNSNSDELTDKQIEERDDKAFDEFTANYSTVGNNSIIDKKNKVQYFFHNTSVMPTAPARKEQSREELCADLKGKFEPRGTDRYAFCMGTQVHQGPTCKNSHGDPCGTTYDKSRAGYTINKD